MLAHLGLIPADPAPLDADRLAELAALSITPTDLWLVARAATAVDTGVAELDAVVTRCRRPASPCSTPARRRCSPAPAAGSERTVQALAASSTALRARVAELEASAVRDARARPPTCSTISRTSGPSCANGSSVAELDGASSTRDRAGDDRTARRRSSPAPVAIVPPQRAPLVSFVAVAYGTGPIIVESIRSLVESLAGTGIAYEYVVVDNLHPTAPRRARHELLLVDRRRHGGHPRRNVGFGGGCELGALHARGEVLAFVNPDVVFAPGWIEPLLATIEDAPPMRRRSRVARPRRLGAGGRSAAAARTGRPSRSPWRHRPRGRAMPTTSRPRAG